MAPRPTDRLAAMIGAFRRERLLADYLDDARLLAQAQPGDAAGEVRPLARRLPGVAARGTAIDRRAARRPLGRHPGVDHSIAGPYLRRILLDCRENEKLVAVRQRSKSP